MNRSRACDNCARSKTKCIWTEDELCQRCTKLQLSCTSTPPGPRKPRGKSTRVTNLEQKVNDLMNMLSTAPPQQQASPASVSTPASDQQPQQPQQQPALDQPPSFVVAWSQDIPHPPPSHFSQSSVSDKHEYIEFVAGFRVSFAEADRILHEYLTDLLPTFPFVPITHCSARDLYDEKPLLLKTIIYSCRPQPPSVQSAIDRWYREYFAYHIVVLNERRLELLQSILVFVAWRDVHFFAHANDTSIVQLALGMLGDLGLNRPPETQRVLPKSILDDATIAIRGVTLQTARTLADRRTLLGLFYVTTETGTHVRRSHPMPYSNYMEKCCEALLEAQDQPTDILLVSVIRMQRVLLQANSMFPEKGPSEPRTPLAGTDALAMVTIRQRVEDIMAQVPDYLRTSYLLRSHYHSVLARIHEPVIYMLPSPAPTHQILTRTQALWDCLLAIKSVYELLASVPAELQSALSFVLFSHLSFANVTLSRLALTKDQDWDPVAALKNADMMRVMQCLGDQFEMADRLGGLRYKTSTDGKGFFRRLADKTNWVKGWYHKRLPQLAGETPSPFPVSDVVMTGSTPIYNPAEDAQFWQTILELDQPVFY
ncbi:hypothetical protein BX600DRAFT_467243 [Xylariales sp. PMI_506]|nr:hypothetical protein BX600DRAFT_467243 [Xylariales sp. PMI_506]